MPASPLCLTQASAVVVVAGLVAYLCGCDENVQPPFLRCLRFSYVRGKVTEHVVTRDSSWQCKGLAV
jgi:hypothetical protein